MSEGCTSSPRVAVLVAAYNAAATLDRCLDSLCSQTLSNIEIMCVDDCSTDDTYDILRTRSRLDNRIHVMKTHENSGQAIARNLALEQVTAPYVCMVDADDWISLDALKSALDVFRDYPQTDCCVFHLIQHFEDGHEEDFGLPTQLANGGVLSGREAFELCLDGWQLHGLYVTRTALHKHYPFDTTTRLYSDDNTSRIHYVHSREVRACAGIYYYSKHSASLTNSFNIHRFDFMEANLSLRQSLLALGEPDISPKSILQFECNRWYTFLACYRLYIEHKDELSLKEENQLKSRFAFILSTFHVRELPLNCRCRPGYWFVPWLWLFDLQQRLFMYVRSQISSNVHRNKL